MSDTSFDSTVLEAIAALGRALAHTGEPYMIIGGIAVIARGVVRLTDDVDATIWGENIGIDDLLSILTSAGIVGRVPDIARFARQHQVLLLRHEASRTPIEVSLAWLPFEQDALARADRIELGGIRTPVALPEDLIVYKAVAWREQDRADVEQLLRLHAGTVDLERVRALVSDFAQALDEPERVAAFEVVVDRAVGDVDG